MLLIVLSTFFSFSASANSSILLTLSDANGFTRTFTKQDLEALPQETITTTTPWTKGSNTYEGPKLSAVVNLAPKPFDSFTTYALNDYSYTITKEDLKHYQFILAMKENGKEMNIRNNGPLWILIPFSEHPGIKRGDEILNMLVWQLTRIEIN